VAQFLIYEYEQPAVTSKTYIHQKHEQKCGGHYLFTAAAQSKFDGAIHNLTGCYSRDLNWAWVLEQDGVPRVYQNPQVQNSQ
jgi:hypothetical protein